MISVATNLATATNVEFYALKQSVVADSVRSLLYFQRPAAHNQQSTLTASSIAQLLALVNESCARIV